MIDTPPGGESVLTYELDADEAVSHGVVAAVAAASGRDAKPGEPGRDALSPLFEAVDPDALDALYDALATGESDTGCISFSYDGYEVMVQSHGVLRVRTDPAT